MDPIKYPSKLNIYNLKSFFNYKPISSGQIIPGMLLSFNYNSPGGVHDRSPLIYVLEAEQDRVWGLNLHYQFILLGESVQTKRAEISSITPEKNQPIQQTNNLDPKVRPEQLNGKNIQSLPEFKQTLGVNNQPLTQQKPTYTPQLLEHYTLAQQPKEILRNYLYTRVSGLQKLVFKVA
jgi:hypothetical protein